ncbi:tyrosine-protein phosphatase [Sphingomonas sp. ID0503]|uniref:tyrosine-protein phosphatase n=1 Tax=Sphingomonas sp. ID0503 TaxID=3399691 RepID=UPI003AFA4E82
MATQLASRFLPIGGGVNFRDFGGYPTEDGGTVRQGMLFRSGSMAFLDEDAKRTLRDLGIVSICDLRRTDERAHEPTAWHEPEATDYWSRDHAHEAGALGKAIHHADIDAESIRQGMIGEYRQIPVDQAPAYREIVERLAAGRVPLLLNCAAGKDRTGIAVATVLGLLGVPREIIMEDYLLTGQADLSMLLKKAGGMIRRLIDRAPDAVPALIAADPAYLQSFFAWADQEHGGIEGYAGWIGVAPDTIAAMRERLISYS